MRKIAENLLEQAKTSLPNKQGKQKNNFSYFSQQFLMKNIQF